MNLPLVHFPGKSLGGYKCMTCTRCGEDPGQGHVFCQHCGKLVSADTLRSIRLPGFVGVQHSTSPRIAEFWETGDPEVFDRP